MVKVIVDHSLCNGDSICADICPMNCFDMIPQQVHNNEIRSVATREEDCIMCMACVSACPTQAIIVED